MEHHVLSLETKFSDTTPGEFSGYGSVFGVTDLVGDVVMPGAYAKTLKEWKKKGRLPAMLWQHDMKQPIGVWTAMKEDERGLAVEGRLILDNVPKAQEAYALMKGGAVTGLSIGFQTRDFEMDRKTGVRRLKEIGLHELSIVTSPALPDAQISTVKTGFLALTDRELEALLRDEADLSHSKAKTAVAVLRKALRDEGTPAPNAPRDEDGFEAIARALADLEARIRS